MDPDRVLTVNEYCDGPRLGVAEFNGVPHIYEAEFDHSGDEYGDTYFLSPIDTSLLALVVEDWTRHEELRTAIGNRRKSDPVNRSLFRAKFTAAEPSTAFNGFMVEWHTP